MISRIVALFTGGSAMWWIVGGLTLALAGVGYLLYDAIEDKGRLSAELKQSIAAHERTKREMRVQAEVYEAGDRAVVALTEYRDVVVQTRTVTVVREIEKAPDARTPSRAPLRLAWERMHALDDIERQSGDPGAAGGPAAGAATPASPSRGNPDRR